MGILYSKGNQEQNEKQSKTQNKMSETEQKKEINYLNFYKSRGDNKFANNKFDDDKIKVIAT